MGHKSVWKKRNKSTASDREASSANLRACQTLINQKRYPEALTRLNQEASNPNPETRQKVLAMAADLEASQGRFASALSLYEKLSRDSEQDSRSWLRPLFARIRILLGQAEVEKARQLAWQAAATAEQKEAKFRAEIKQVGKTLAPGQQFVVLHRPARASVVITRLGFAFLKEGELVSARDLFERVVQINPKGGTRARLGLAEIALKSGDLPEAITRVEQAMHTGKYQAKTLSGWPILIAARQRSGMEGIKNKWMDGLAAQKEPAVRARAVLLMAKNFRQWGDPAWKTVAQTWLRDEPQGDAVIRTELEKLLLSECTLNHEQPGQAALAVLVDKKLAPHEWLCAVRRKYSGPVGGDSGG